MTTLHLYDASQLRLIVAQSAGCCTIGYLLHNLLVVAQSADCCTICWLLHNRLVIATKRRDEVCDVIESKRGIVRGEIQSEREGEIWDHVSKLRRS